jgi:hypothetical protein
MYLLIFPRNSAWFRVWFRCLLIASRCSKSDVTILKWYHTNEYVGDGISLGLYLTQRNITGTPARFVFGKMGCHGELGLVEWIGPCHCIALAGPDTETRIKPLLAHQGLMGPWIRWYFETTFDDLSMATHAWKHGLHFEATSHRFQGLSGSGDMMKC